MLIDEGAHTSLSDSFDPSPPAREVPGGIVESVQVAYDTAEDLAFGFDDVQNWLRSSNEPITVNDLTLSVQRHIEQEFGLALVPQTVTAVLTGPSREAELPRTPSRGLTSVKRIVNGERQADVSDNHYVLSGVLNAKSGAVIDGAPIEVVYEAGFDPVPQDIQTAIKRIVTDLFDHRGDLSDTNVDEIPRNAKSLLRNYRN